jgi:hypothetical protein
MGMANVAAVPVWNGAQAGAASLNEKLYQATHSGDPSFCLHGLWNVYCSATRENMARQKALGQTAIGYGELATAVQRCDAGKVPAPPYNEQECDKYRALVNEIDARVAELKKSGAV